MSETSQPLSASESLARRAESARMRADVIDELVLDALERRAEGIRQKLSDEPGASLTGPDITALKEVRELAHQRADRAEEVARQAGAAPDDPRMAQLGFALLSGDLTQCWKLLKTLSDESGEWISVEPSQASDAELEEMPEGLQQALSDPEKWSQLDAAMLYDLRKATEHASDGIDSQRGQADHDQPPSRTYDSDT